MVYTKMSTNNIISIPPEHIPSGMKAVHIGMPFLQTAMDELASFSCKKVFVMANKSSIKFIEGDDTKLVNVLQSKGLLAAPLCTSINMGGAEEGLLKACDDAYTAHADLVMTVGGGAVQDAGKLVRLWLSTKSDNDKNKKIGCTVEGLQAATEQDPMPELPPQICMPNSFAMAEATHIAGLVTKLKSKSGAAHVKLLPTTIIYDPVLSSGLPDWVRFGTSLRGVEHAIGAITHPKANEDVRTRALEGLSILGDNLTKLISDPESATLQSNLYMGGFIAIRALNMGCYPTIGHLIENQYSAKFNVHQGSCSGIFCARIMDYHYINSREYQQRISAALGTENKPAPQIVRDLIASLPEVKNEHIQVDVTSEMLLEFTQWMFDNHNARYTVLSPRKFESAEDMYNMMTKPLKDL